MRPWTISRLRAACEIPCSKSGPWASYAQRLVWTYGEAGALERLNSAQKAAA